MTWHASKALLLEDGKDTSISVYKIIEDNFSENPLNIIIRIKSTIYIKHDKI